MDAVSPVGYDVLEWPTNAPEAFGKGRLAWLRIGDAE